jgi:hypothetical protein
MIVSTFVVTVHLYVNMIVSTFDCTSEVGFAFEMTYRFNFDLLSFLQNYLKVYLKKIFGLIRKIYGLI